MSNRRRARSASLALLGVLLGLAGAPTAALAQCELARLVASDGAENDWLGTKAAISGDFGFVATTRHDGQGSNSGAVYVARRGAAGWGFVDTLMASDGGDGTGFGTGLSVQGDRALIGSTHGAYAFERTPSGWTEVQKLVAADAAPGDLFGLGVAIQGDRALVSAPQQDSVVGESAGAAYIFERGPSGWVEVDKLVSPEPRAHDYFGGGALGNDFAVFGVGGHDLHGFQNKGAVFVFERGASGWDDGTKISIYEGNENDRFGSKVAVHRDRFIASAPGERSLEIGGGAVYVFRKGTAGWVREARLIPDGPVAAGFAEHGIQISSDKVLVAAYLAGDAGFQDGRVFVYKRTASRWVFEHRFGGSMPRHVGSFGTAVAVDGDTVLVGARNNGDIFSAGAAYVFSAPIASSVNLCAAAANSTGSPAAISIAGCTQVARNEVRLFARPIPSGTSGVFFYGDRNLAPLPFGDGYRCVGGRVYRLPLVHSVDEEMASDLDLTSPPQPLGQITAGSTWYFQVHYRDTAAGGAGFNLSDALGVVFSD